MKYVIKNRHYIAPLLFAGMLLVGIIHYVYAFITTQDKGVIASRSSLSAFFDTNIFAHDYWIEAYGLEQKWMGKRQVENFTIYKTDYGTMVSAREACTSERIQEEVDAVCSIISYLDEKNIPYYYLTSILPVQDVADLPYGVTEGSQMNFLMTQRELSERKINIIDLSAAETIEAIPKGELFYRTDHHWTMETCFAAYQEIINTVEDELDWDLNGKNTTDKSNYLEYRIANSFLGSYGVKVGKYYAGKDDFVVLLPNFDTDMLFQSFDADGKLLSEKRGDFSFALLDTDILEDPKYNNKYNSFCNVGSIENHVMNFNAPNDLKCLLISHSYGRPLTMYLALNFLEIVNLDPQIGRFSGDYLEYIDKYEPDMVLFQVEFEGEIIGEYTGE